MQIKGGKIMDSTVLMYLHGMNSSPFSDKAQAVFRYTKKYHPEIDCLIPEQKNHPQKNAESLLSMLNSFDEDATIYLVGSSLGGYYATWLRERLLAKFKDKIIKMILINPASKPYCLFDNYLGLQTNSYTNEQYEITMKHVFELKALEYDSISSPHNVLIMLQTGDETLDYRVSKEHYKCCNFDITQGGNHAFEKFDSALPKLFEFLLKNK